ncbi:hypothetical protein [Trinickia mobilis]|uniref:hypothetical protein n=1 Tax=Trinickia mobilis TaxID=2816356 RepID=UPI001A909306|nr:hypothetical protein [Trinickia mobilis]
MGTEHVTEGCKRCARCGEVLPFAAFAKLSAALDGRQGWCKQCFVAYRSEHRAELTAKAKRHSQTPERVEYRRAYCRARAAIDRAKAEADPQFAEQRRAKWREHARRRAERIRLRRAAEKAAAALQSIAIPNHLTSAENES